MAARLTAYVVAGIVAATLIAGLIVGAQRDDNDGPIDLIVHNAQVYTGPDGVEEAVAIRGNRILLVGSDREVNRLRRPQTVIVDAKGGSVLPGFNDAHLQFLEGGLAFDGVDLRDASTLADIQERIREWAAANPERTWVVGRGWSIDGLGEALPTRQLLDTLVPDRPVRLIGRDQPVAWVNTRALRLARIDKRTPDPVNGVIVRDARTGEPTGVLKGAAIALVESLVPPPSAVERARAIRAAVAEAHRLGITSVQDAWATTEELESYAEARKTGDLQVRVYASVRLDPVLEPELREVDALIDQYPDDPLFKAGAVQIVLAAGSESPGGATLAAANGVSSREPGISQDVLNRLVRLLDAQGLQIAVQASDERAVRMALTAFEHAERSNQEPRRGRRHRIEHADFIAAADVTRLANLDVVASMQPLREAASLYRTSGRSRVPDESIAVPGYHAVAEARGRLTFGSGWPDAPLNPILGLRAAVGETLLENDPDAPLTREQRLTLKTAVDAYTSGASWASFDDQRKGTIERGMLADLVVLSDDIFSLPLGKLTSAAVEVTIFDGKIVYRKTDGHTD